MDNKEKNPTQERKIIPNFGDQRIDEARGKSSHPFFLITPTYLNLKNV